MPTMFALDMYIIWIPIIAPDLIFVHNGASTTVDTRKPGHLPNRSTSLRFCLFLHTNHTANRSTRINSLFSCKLHYLYDFHEVRKSNYSLDKPNIIIMFS